MPTSVQMKAETLAIILQAVVLICVLVCKASDWKGTDLGDCFVLYLGLTAVVVVPLVMGYVLAGWLGLAVALLFPCWFYRRVIK